MTIGKKIKSKYGDLTLKIYSYTDNNRLAILLYNEEGELFNDLTINLSNMFISDIDEGFIDDFINSKEFDIVKILKRENVIVYSYGLMNYNYGRYEYVKFNLDKLKEYDNEGYNNYMKLYEV